MDTSSNRRYASVWTVSFATLDPEGKNAQPLGIPPLEDHRLSQLNQTAESQPSIERHIQETQPKALRAMRRAG